MAGRLKVDTGAKKRNTRKKRCKKRFVPCTPGGKRTCCRTLTCEAPYDLQNGSSTDTRCCYREGHGPCQVNNDCCYPAFCSGGECVTNSDRARKENFAFVDTGDMLTRVGALHIVIRNDPAAGRSIGPSAAEFAALFGTGGSAQSIHSVDGQGIALAAIQGVVTEIDRLRVRNSLLDERIARLERERFHEGLP